MPPPLLGNYEKEVKHNRLYYDKAIFVFLCMENAKIDFGHDLEVEGKECKDGRSRTWMLLLYPDNPEHKAVLDDKLFELDWNFAGRVHDKDDGVKEHHHVVVLFKDGRKNADIAADLGIDKRWLRAWDRQKKALRYLCHRDNPEKFQYSTDGIYGTIAEKAVGACSKGNELSEAQAVKEVTQFFREYDGYISMSEFVNAMADRGNFAVVRRMGNFALRLLDEHNNNIRVRIVDEIKQMELQERAERFAKIGEAKKQMDFGEYVDRINRQGYFPPEQPL